MKDVRELTDRVINGDLSVFELGETQIRLVLIDLVQRLKGRPIRYDRSGRRNF